MSKESEELPDLEDECPLYDADPNCKHKIVSLWSGVKCSKCSGWFCY